MENFFEDYETLGLPGGPNELKRFTNGFIISERGQWDYPGQPTAVPTPSGRITMEGVEDDLLGIDNLGNTQYMTPGNEYQFDGDMVYEIPQAKKGGSKKKASKKYSRSLMAKNRLFAKNLLFEKKKSAKNKIFDPNSPYYQPGGETDLPQNVGFIAELDDNEIEEYRKGGYIVEDISVPSLTRMQDGGDNPPERTFTPLDPNYIAEHPDEARRIQNEGEVSTEREGSDIGKLRAEFRKKNPMDIFLDEKKRQFLKKNKGLNKSAGVTMEKFPEDVLQNFIKDYEYKTNNYAVNKLGKKEGWNPKRRGEWVDELTPGEKDAVAESKYGSKLQPSYWSRSLAGLQELGNEAIKLLPGEQGDVMKFNIPGLTKKEQKEIRESKLGALETFAPMDIPGAAIANLAKNTGLTTGSDYKEQANALAGEKMANVTDIDALALNPLTYAGLESIPELVLNAPKLLKNSGKLIGKGAEYVNDVVGSSRATGKLTLPKYKNVYRAEHAGFNVPAVDNSLTGRWFANNPEEIDFYIRKLKDPVTGEVIMNADAPVRILKKRLPEYKINQNFGAGMPEDARIMSMGSGDLTNAQLNELLGPDADRRFRIGSYTQGDINAMATAPFLYRPSEGILDPTLVNQLRADGNLFGGKQEAMNFLFNESENIKNAKPFRAYLPFKQGGIISNLTKKEIDKLIKQGYMIEDVSEHSLTKASYGHSVGNLIRKQEGGSISGTQGLTTDFSQRLTQFILDAKAQGIDLGIGSGYRSYEKQKRLWEQALKKYGSAEKARKWVAPPGGSFHNKGLAVDLNSNGQFLGKEANSKATEWAHANAKKYGLHFRMGHEPWHIEPIEKTKSSSGHDHVHDDDVIVDKYGDQPKPTTEEEYNKMIELKNLEFEAKQKELEERERALHDDDYSKWKPAKKEVVDERQQVLDAYSQIIAPSSKNVFEQYATNLQGQMKNGGLIMELDDNEINHYKNKGYIIEELPKAQEGIQINTPVWSNINNNNLPTIQNSIPEIEKIITEKTIIKPEVESESEIKLKPIITNNNEEKTFEEVHAEARNNLGPNAIFQFNGRKYGTNNPGEDFKPDEKTLESFQLNTENIKENINKQNNELNDPYLNKKTVKVQEKEYEDWDKIKEKNIELNKSSNANKIIKYKTSDKSGKNYIIIDKKKGLLHIYSPGSNQPLFSAPVDLGANVGDAQTTTKVKDTNGDGVIDNIEAQKAKADFSLGNKMTGAGKYYISNIDPKGYGDLPLFNMMNESQYSNYLKTGKIDNVATSLHKGYISDDKNRVSNGCIRCNITTLKNLTKYLQNSSEVYILPEDEGNEFIYENGQLNFKVKHKGDLYTYKNNGKIYKKENNTWYVAPKAGSSFTKITEGSRIKELNKNATNAGYNYYVDSHGKVQKGQGVNKGPTLNYIPIKTSLDEEKFRDEKFTAWDFNDEQELKKVKEFTKSLQDNKQKIMKAAKINGDVYNDIAKITFGIFGTESNYADTHSGVGNFARAVNKALSPSSSSSPDYLSKYYTYGANEDYRSVGPTQMRWSYLNEDEKKALKEVGIKSNSELMYPSNAALATAVVLGIRYNQQLNDKEKKDIWKNLPKTWNTRANYADRVKDNSKYLILEQKNIKDPKLIAKSNIKDVYVYKGNANAKYKKDKNGNWYVNYGNKTKNKFIRLNDPTGARSKLLDANAIKLKKFTR